jgi:hypothetical protein
MGNKLETCHDLCGLGRSCVQEGKTRTETTLQFPNNPRVTGESIKDCLKGRKIKAEKDNSGEYVRKG